MDGFFEKTERRPVTDEEGKNITVTVAKFKSVATVLDPNGWTEWGVVHGRTTEWWIPWIEARMANAEEETKLTRLTPAPSSMEPGAKVTLDGRIDRFRITTGARKWNLPRAQIEMEMSDVRIVGR